MIHRILAVLSEPSASARQLDQLIDQMPVLAARLRADLDAGVMPRPARAS